MTDEIKALKEEIRQLTLDTVNMSYVGVEKAKKRLAIKQKSLNKLIENQSYSKT